MGIYYLAGFLDTYGDNTWARFVEKGVPTAILGMLTVFAVLAILWGCLEVFKYVFYTLPEQRKKTESAQTAVEPDTAPREEQTYADDGEIVAAIIAAITAARAEESNGAPAAFRVVSFRKRK